MTLWTRCLPSGRTWRKSAGLVIAGMFALLGWATPAAAESLVWGPAHQVTSAPIESLSCPSVAFCAAGSAVDVFTTTQPLLQSQRWRAHAAGRFTAPVTGAMPVISCAGAKLCLASDFDAPAEAVASASPLTAGAHAWRQLADGPPGPFRTYGLRGLACPTQTLCVAGDATGGQLEVSRTPTSLTEPWSVVTVPHAGYNCYAGSGPQPTRCAAQIDAVACPSASLCLTMDSSGELDVSTDPGALASHWSYKFLALHEFVPGYDELDTQMSCPTVHFCAVVYDPTGQVFTSTDPTGGLSAWHATSLGDRSLQAISCAGVRLCVAVDARGEVLTSLDPSGAAPYWSRTRLIDPRGFDAGFLAPQTSGLTGVACPTATACITVDGRGDWFVGRVGTGERQASPRHVRPADIS